MHYKIKMAEAKNVEDNNTEEEKFPFKKAQVKLAVSALLAHLKDKEKDMSQKKKDELFHTEEIIQLVLGMKKIPSIVKKPLKIPVPHNYNTDIEVCLISKEPGKVVKQKLVDSGITNISKVISLTKLRKEYKTFALKRQLFTTYDVFLCDDRIYHFATKTLGKEFFKRKKEPIPIRLTYQDWKAEIAKSLNCALLRLGHGPCSTIKVGSLTQQSEKELVQNAIHIMKVVGRRIPGKWKNIKSFHIKSSTSVALPVYQSSPLTDVSMEIVNSKDT